MKNEKKHETSSWRSMLSSAAHRARLAARRCAQPALSGFLALTMVVGSVPAPAYAQMIEEATRSLALIAQQIETEDDATASPNEADVIAEGAVQADAVDDGAVEGAAPEDGPAAQGDEAGSADAPAEQAATEDSSQGDQAPAATDDGTADAATEEAAPAPQLDGAQQADAPAADPEQEDAFSAQFNTNGELAAVTVGGDALASRSAAASALKGAGASGADARRMAATLFSSRRSASPLKKDGSSLPGEADGTKVEWISASWMTDDTVDNGNADLLYLKPRDASATSVSMRVSYGLSGDHDYPAGSIVITIPVTMFENREGNVVGSMRLSVPADPSTRMEWNYKLVDDTYQITNTRKLPASTEGYMEFAVEGLKPMDLVDMQTSKNFDPSIEVTTNAGMLIGAKSNILTAQIDTEAKITDANKKVSEEPRIVESSEIPEGQRIKGEDRYLLVTWYMSGYVPNSTTQKYTASLVDEKADEHKGFIIDQTEGDSAGSADAFKSSKTVQLNNGEPSSKIYTTEYTTVKVAYPMSQFTKNTPYTFKNKVTYTLKELDSSVTLPDGAIDEQETTTASSEASVEWSYSDPEFTGAPTNIELFAYGSNLSSVGSGMITTSPSGHSASDLASVDDPGYSPFDGYYGRYPAALNDLQGGTSPVVSYTLNTVGYLLPWTYKEVKKPEGSGNPEAMLDNYGHVPVTLTTEDEGLSLNDTGAGAVYDHNLKAGTDFTYTAVEFPEQPSNMKAVAVNLDENGNSTAQPGETSTIEYAADETAAVTPDVTLQIKRDGVWEDYAVATWKTGELVLTVEGQPAEKGVSRVEIPADAEGVRTVATTKNAAVLYHVRVYVALHNAGTLGKQVAKAFEGSSAPSLSVWNYVTLDAKTNTEGGGTEHAETAKKRGYNRLQGYSTDTRAQLSSKASSGDGNINYSKRQVTVDYTANMEYRSHIASKASYEEALAAGRLLAQEGCTWYSLLPEGFAPKMDTIKLRKGDTIREMYSVENYRGTGRTLLVVSADLSPQPTQYWADSNVQLYQDVPSISFSALTSFETLEDQGLDTHCVMVYQSDNEELGSIEGFCGEPDDPRAGKNTGTKDAFETDAERDALTDLDAATNDPVFLYAGASQKMPDTLHAGTAGLSKTVMVNNDGIWSAGVGENEPQRDAYAGGYYAYRLAMRNSESTQASGIIFYDSLENYTMDGAGETWKGTFAGVDVSALKKAGCAPKVYYSTQADLAFEQGDAAEGTKPEAIEENLDLKNTSIWAPLTEDTDLATVKAIAIDASKMVDGADFVLNEGETASAYIRMRAPQGSDAQDFIESDAHAYNTMYLYASANNEGTGDALPELARGDYTAVGLKNYTITVENSWVDDGDRDGMRPDELVLHLYANGVSAEKTGLVPEGGATLVLTGPNDWKGSFGTLPAYTEDGSKIVYSVKEDVPKGYTADIRLTGETATIVNTHVPETVTVSGTKTWSGDSSDVRPSSIKVDLYSGAHKLASRTVRPNSVGMWTYEFRNLNKYSEGNEISYTVKEDMSSYPSYASTVSGTDIHNAYHPYGDLVISKEVHNTSVVSNDMEFSFELEFSREAEQGDGQDSTTEPVFNEYDYKVYEGESEVGEGTISTNGVITLKGGQRAVIHDVDEGVSYKVTENEVAGFTADATEKSGVIEPNQTVEAAFVNTYEATAAVNFKALKVLSGRALRKGLFNFELVDEDTGTVIRTAQNAAATSSEMANGTVVETAPAEFGATTYTQADHGKTFKYIIREMDTGLGGYTYSTAVYHAEVAVTDKGDGTLATKVTYKDAEGIAIENPLDREHGVVFENAYAARAELSLQAAKKLTVGKLQDQQFTFGLGVVSVDDNGAATYQKRSDAKNAADGTITFVPVVFTQDDAGSTRYVAIHEVAGSDQTITYDDHYALVKVDVVDNADGTLSLSTKMDGFEVPCWNHAGDSCAICGGDKVVTAEKNAFVFQNAYKDGTLTIEKTVQGEGDPDKPEQLFDFRVELTNEEGQPVEVNKEDIAIGKIGEQATEPVVAAADVEDEAATESTPLSWLLDRGREAWDALTGIFAPEQAYAATATTLPDSGNEGTWEWNIDVNGNLTISGMGINGSADLRAHAADVKTATFVQGASAAEFGSFFSGFENMTSVKFNGLDATNAHYTGSMFSGCKSLTTLDLTGVKFRVVGADNMFSGCSSLESVEGLDLSSTPTGGKISVQNMFSGCSALKTLDLSGLDGGSIEKAIYLLNGCKSLESVNVSGLVKAGVNDLYGAFQGCSSLKGVDLSTWDFSTVSRMSFMFQGCTILESVTFPEQSDWAVTEADHMFQSCEKLGSMDFTNVDLSKVTNMQAMFDGCTSLTSVVFPRAAVSKAANMGYMFRNCTSLATADFSAFDMSAVSQMEFMFYSCQALADIKFPEVKQASAKSLNMKNMFNNCDALVDLDLSTLDLSRATSFFNMLANCENLKTVKFPEAGESTVTDMSYMFTASAKLETVDFSQFDLRAVTSMAHTFDGCSKLSNLHLPSVPVSSVKSMDRAFLNCKALQNIDFSRFDLSKVTNMGVMFSGCTALETVVFPTSAKSAVTNLSYMFQNCGALTAVDFSKFDLSAVTNMSNMFVNCGKLTAIKMPRVEKSSVTNTNDMFKECGRLGTVDLSSFDLSMLKDAARMFGGCKSLSSVKFHEGAMQNLGTVSWMFGDCSALTELDLASFAPKASTNMSGMFTNCSHLRKVKLGDQFRFNGAVFPTGSLTLGAQNRTLQWIQVDESGAPIGEPMSATNLASKYKDTVAPAGTYVWNTFALVSFHANLGSGSMPRAYLDLEKGGELQLASVGSSIYRPSYKFVNWNTQASGKGTAVADGAALTAADLFTMVDGELKLTLYAQWEFVPSVEGDPTKGSFEFKMPAGYQATIKNLPAGTTYRVYENTPAGWQLVEVSGDNGVITAETDAKASFVNEYRPDAASARIMATKKLDGAWAQPESGFTFTLTETTGDTETVIQQDVPVSAGGTIEFAPIEYTAAGTHTYKITEDTGTDGTIEYDAAPELVTVNVTAEDGKLNAAVVYGDGDGDAGVAAFDNMTKSGSLAIAKVVEGSTTSMEFNFMLTLGGVPYDGEYQVGSDTLQATDGVIKLKGGQTATISDIPAGTAYAVSETGIPSGWSLKGSEGATGSITAAATATATFTNAYAATGEAQLMAYKRMEHASIVDGQFTFELLRVAEGGRLESVATAQNGPVDTAQTVPGANGADRPNPVYGMAPVCFPALSYSAPGIYEYVMREIASSGSGGQGSEIDKVERKATVTVADNGDGTLSTSVSYENGQEIENKGNLFTGVLKTSDLIVEKRVPEGEANEVTEGAEFTFDLSMSDSVGAALQGLDYEVQTLDGKPVEGASGSISDGGEVRLHANQRAVIKGLPYGSTYEVSEREAAGWSQVADETTGVQGTILGEAARAVVTNAYDATGTVELEAVKKLNGRPLKDGQFTFALRDVTEGSDDYGKVIQEVGNKEDGGIVFKPLEFTDADHGKTFTYEITELAQAADGDYVFDDAVVTATVAVKDKGDGTLEFEVRYDGEGKPHIFENWVAAILPRTGGAGVGLAGVLVLALGCAMMLRRKRELDK